MKNSNTIRVNGGALPVITLTIANLTDQQADQINSTAAAICRAALHATAGIKPRHPHAGVLSKIMIEAHARAKADYADELSCRGRAHHVNRPYSYYLGLQMRSGFAEARVARTGMAPAFELPPQRWA
ncbi:hypothetical protein ABIB06_004888 [Bradyrhizobium sp. LB8.2]|uniref:hypothetical protein n=1 Tax=Bradyrhizobium sp. LB8.2 TaxID=3156330 RepID=UPI00339406A4